MEHHQDIDANEFDSDNVFIGSRSNFWRFSPNNGFDLTRRSHEGKFIRFDTTTTPIIIDPERSGLLVIDMQNFFLHPTLRSHEPGLAASKQLLHFVIPAARDMNMQVIWVNWGLTQEDIDQMPLGLQRAFRSDIINTTQIDSERKKIYKGLGESLGEIELPDGKCVDAGRLLMQDTWNARLYDPLLESYDKSQLSSKPDKCFYKNRISGLWCHESPLLSYLQTNKLITLFFAGVNTDQCVSGTLQDALNKGFDCILLRDACGTNSPLFAQQCIEYNCTYVQGFVMEAEAFAKGVDTSKSF